MHVQSQLLRHILNKEPRHLSRGDVETALNATLDALGRDLIRTDIPARAVLDRIAAARQADATIRRRQRTKAHQALRSFWSI